MSLTQNCNEDAGEVDVCAEPIRPEEIPPGNGTSVVSICHEGAGKAGLCARPIVRREVNVNPTVDPTENLDVSRHVQNKPERIEDVFQDDIIRRFMGYQSFRQFALAGNGLRLSRYDVQTIEDDNCHKSVENKKLELLNKWLEKNNGPDAVKKIKEIATTHLESRNT